MADTLPLLTDLGSAKLASIEASLITIVKTNTKVAALERAARCLRVLIHQV